MSAYTTDFDALGLPYQSPFDWRRSEQVPELPGYVPNSRGYATRFKTQEALDAHRAAARRYADKVKVKRERSPEYREKKALADKERRAKAKADLLKPRRDPMVITHETDKDMAQMAKLTGKSQRESRDV